MGIETSAIRQMKKQKKSLPPLLEQKRAEKRKLRELRKLTKSVLGYSRIGRNQV